MTRAGKMPLPLAQQRRKRTCCSTTTLAPSQAQHDNYVAERIASERNVRRASLNRAVCMHSPSVGVAVYRDMLYKSYAKGCIQYNITTTLMC